MLNYRSLLDQVESTCASLNSAGVGKGDVVAIVLPEGPEMTTAFIAAANAAVSAPINPACQLAEFENYFSELEVKALITQTGFCPPAEQAAQNTGVAILTLFWSHLDPAGRFTLQATETERKKNTGLASAEDLLMVCYTSGTTARPKIVPLTHGNISISAQNIVRSLQLTESDRCLNVMPVFHLHGSLICTISSLAAGGSVIAAPRFNAPMFLEWLADCHPTWFSASPSIHHSVLMQAHQHPERIADHKLRFIRSSAAAMPPDRLEEMETVFEVPFIEGYGLSETAHLLTSNFLPPFKRKRGSVGVPAGPEVAVMDAASARLLQPYEKGEVVARGENVMSGYLKNPDANQQAFCNGWFRTGDQGYKDAEGYFYITGRIKEIINRGGEKISPREVDEALLTHPDVLEAAAFAVPHEQLGEEVAAAVVLNQANADEKSLKRYLEPKLAYFKIPAHILITDSIPKGPTGKVLRNDLAEIFKDLGPSLSSETPDWQPPQTAVEKEIARLWEEVLCQKNIGANQTFFSLGGDSILAGSLALRLQETFHVKLSLIDLFDAPTVSEQAGLVQKYVS